MGFFVTLIAVAVMLLYAIPGYFMVRTKAIEASAIPAFAKLLMFVCQPCLTIYSFLKVPYRTELLKEMLYFFLITLLIQGVILIIFSFLLRNKKEKVEYRVGHVATCFGNVAFMGVPLVEALLPDYPEAVIFCSLFLLSMSILGWTAASAIITRDRKYISIKKVLLNPAVLSMAVALPLFMAQVTLPNQLLDVITLMGKMTTPLCMLVMGMRLATMKFSAIFQDKLVYGTILIKQIIMPLAALLLIQLLPFDQNLETTLYILCACPIASVVLNFAEMLGEGQETAANMVLLGTMLSVVTIPFMMLLV